MSVPGPANRSAVRPLTATATATPAPPAKTRGAAHGQVQYLEQPKNGEELYAFIKQAPEGQEPSNMEKVQREVTVTDVRPQAGKFTLAKNGFELHKLQVPSDIDWQNEAEVKEKYYPAVEALLKNSTGATRVHIFDHMTRTGHLPADQYLRGLRPEDRNKPVGMVHVDYTAESGLRRLHMLLPDEAEKLKQTPFAIIQVWRPLHGPVQSAPLGVIDASTVEKEDLLSYRIEFPGRTGYNYGLKYNPNHRWYFADGINADEAYVFVCYESRGDRARFTPHTGFRDLATTEDAPPRESVELRSLCFFENEPQQEVALDL